MTFPRAKQECFGKIQRISVQAAIFEISRKVSERGQPLGSKYKYRFSFVKGCSSKFCLHIFLLRFQIMSFRHHCILFILALFSFTLCSESSMPSFHCPFHYYPFIVPSHHYPFVISCHNHARIAPSHFPLTYSNCLFFRTLSSISENTCIRLASASL